MRKSFSNSFLFAFLFVGAAHAELSLSIGNSGKYGVSSAVGIFGPKGGLELGVMGGKNTVQYPGGSRVEEGPKGLDGILFLGEGRWKLYAGVGAYFWRETTLTPGPGAIVQEDTKDHVVGAASFGIRSAPSSDRHFTFGAGFHTIRGPNLSLGFQW